MRTRFVLTGPDPDDPTGGVAVAMAGYRDALASVELLEEVLPSYRRGPPVERWGLAARAAPRLVAAVRRLRRRGFEPVVYAHGGGWLGLLRQSLLLLLARRAGARTLLHVHSPRTEAYLENVVGRRLLELCFARADVVCVLTEGWRDRLEAAGVEARLAVVPNPLSSQLEAVAAGDGAGASTPRPAGELRVLTLTRLVPGKGVDLAIRALTSLPDRVRLTVAGEGGERRRLEALVGDLGLDARVRFAGWVDGEHKRRLLASSDVFLLPTRRDSFGMGFLEAMAHGLPVVALRWGAVPDVVPGDRAGLLVDAADPEALAAAVRTLEDPARRDRMGAAGRAWVLEQFAPDVVGRRLRAVARSLRVPEGPTGTPGAR